MFFKDAYGWENIKEHRKDPRNFRLHNFRTTAISRARQMGISPGRAKEWFGVSPPGNAQTLQD